MEQYVVSARKYRPRKFEDVVGQEGVTRTLKNAIRSGHLAHALLFCGPRGVGKTTCARILSRMINSEQPVDEFDPGQASQDIDRFNIYELDAASNNSVDDIRALVDQVRFPPQTGKYKVYIIDEVHMLSTAAFNAFLKTLEEPPPYAIFILATTEKHKILPTILSRCQIYDFNRITIEDMVGHLRSISEQEGIAADQDALHIIAQKADGALRDSLSLFDRLADHSTKQLTYQSVLENLNILDYDYYFHMTDQLMAQDLQGIMLSFDEVIRKGFEGDNFISGLAEHFRNLMVSKNDETIKILEVSDELKQRYRQQGAIVPNTFLLNALNLANQCEVQYKTSKNKRLHVELALMKMCYLPSVMNLKEAADSKKNSITDQAEPAKKPEPQPEKPVQQPETEQHSQPEDLLNGHHEPQQPPQNVAREPEAPKVAPTEASPENENSTPAPEPQPKTVSKPDINKRLLSGGNSISGVSLSNIGKKEKPVEEEVKISDEEKANIVIDPEQLKTAWAGFAEEMRQKGSTVVYQAIKEMIPQNEGPKITITLGNSVQLDRVNDEKQFMHEYLTKELSLKYLEIHVELDKTKDDNTPKRAFTSKEKLARMVEKNPQVRTLIEKLDLQIDD